MKNFILLILMLGFILFVFYNFFAITDKEKEFLKDNFECSEKDGVDPLEGRVFNDYKKNRERTL